MFRIINVYSKDTIKEEAKRLFYRSSGVLISILIFCIYLAINNIWYEFIDYTILGLKTFSNKMSYINLVNGNYGRIIQILSILMPLLLIYLYIRTILKKVTTKEDKILYIFFAYSLASIVVIYPISDNCHFLIGILPLLVSLIYILYNKLKNIVSDKYKPYIKIIIKVYSIFLVLFYIIFSTKTLYKYEMEMVNYKNLKHFSYIISVYEKAAEEVGNYITSKKLEGKQVYILDAQAAFYMIPIDKYNKDFDMFMVGNFGGMRRRRTNHKIRRL